MFVQFGAGPTAVWETVTHAPHSGHKGGSLKSGKTTGCEMRSQETPSAVHILIS